MLCAFAKLTSASLVVSITSYHYTGLVYFPSMLPKFFFGAYSSLICFILKDMQLFVFASITICLR